MERFNTILAGLAGTFLLIASALAPTVAQPQPFFEGKTLTMVKVVEGVHFVDGEEIEQPDQVAA